RPSLDVVHDQFGAPTSAALIADITAHMLAAAWRQPEKSGLYHVASAGQTNWHAYARFVLAQAGAMGLELRCPPDGVKAIAARDYGSAALRPANSRLDTTRLRDAFGLALPAWQDQVCHVLQTILARN